MDLAANSLLAIAQKYGGNVLSGLEFARIARYHIMRSFLQLLLFVLSVSVFSSSRTL